jgi:hypothetical protein
MSELVEDIIEANLSKLEKRAKYHSFSGDDLF